MIAAHFKQLSVEEIANTLTHGVGLVLSVIGFIVLATLAVVYGDRWHITSSIVYGASLVTLYAASTVYHSAISENRKRVLQLVDHCCIYLLIAGSYTPFLLSVLRNSFGVALLAIVWALAAFGIAMKIIFRDRFQAVGIAMYLIMGWIGVVAVQPLYMALGLTPLVLVVAGGVSYTLGMIFFGWKSLKHHHAIFHMFVLAGSIIHFIAIIGFVLRYST